MPTKRAILVRLSRDELLGVLDAYELAVPDRRVKDQLVEVLAESSETRIDDILQVFPRVRLKELCRSLDLDDSGREKALLVRRLSGASTAPQPPAAVTKKKRTDAEGIAYWVGDAASVKVIKRGLQDNQIEEAREAVKNGADIEAEAWKLVQKEIEITGVKSGGHAPSMHNFSEKVSFIWGVADLLRGDYKPSEYGRVISISSADRVSGSITRVARSRASMFPVSQSSIANSWLVLSFFATFRMSPSLTPN